jgi:deoxycytidylate deaminase
MIDSMDARRGADISIKSLTNLRNFEFRSLKKEIKDKIMSNNTSIVTSQYFQYFDTSDTKPIHFKQQHYLNIAAQAAMKSDMNHKHGAIIVYKKNVIASGNNYYKGEHSIHAEVDAISKLRGKEKEILSECELYVVRIGPDKMDNLLKYSKPCCNCQKYIAKKRIKKTYYSTNYDYDIAIAKYIHDNVVKKEM